MIPPQPYIFAGYILDRQRAAFYQIVRPASLRPSCPLRQQEAPEATVYRFYMQA